MTQSVLDDLESPLSSPNGVPAPSGVPPTPQLDLAPPQQPDVPRAFGDTDRTRQLLYDNVRKAASAFQPVANARHTLSLQDVDYHGPETFSIAQQKQAILGRGSPGRKLRGTFVMHDTVSGDEVSRKRVTLATVPHMTQRGTFIHCGNEYTMAHQLRLRPGIFTREKANGEIESHINVSKGLGHRISLDPKSGVFTMNIGQANIPLFPLLKTMGVSESQMRENWGNEITAANMSKDNPKKVSALYKKLCKHGDQNIPDDQKAQSVREAFEKMELDPTVTKRTLGQPFTKVGPDTFLAVTKKLIGVNRGESEVDDRDDLAFQQVMGPEDVFAERLKKPQEALRRILWRASAKGSLDHAPAGAFDEHIRSALLKTGLGMPLEEINPADVFDQQVRATRMGEGGLSADAVPDESRAVQPSQLGFIDFLRTPESGKVGVDFRLAGNARKGADGRLYTQVQPWEHGQSSGALMHKAAPELSDAVLAFPGEMKRNTPWVTALVDGKVKNVKRDSVQFELPHMEHTFSPLGNMVPLKSMVKGQRAVMAARMITQALPLVDPEAPFVQSGMPDQPGRSYEEEYAKHMGVLRADAPGRVVSVDRDGIAVQYADGSKRVHELYDNFPFNRKTFLHQTPLVAPGDTVGAGQILAHSNFTDKQGTTALGKNLRVAYIPFKGKSFEDAIVISRSAATRLSSEHMYQHGLDLEDESMTAGKSFFRSMFPGKYSKEQMENFTDDGVIKPGTKVHPGDPLILAARQQPASARSVHRKLSPLDASVTWDHHSEGVVTDIDTTGKGLNVVVKSTAEMAVGDKLCFDPRTWILTKRGWVLVADLHMDDEIATLNAAGELEYQHPTHLWKYRHDGPMYYLNTKHVNMLVTLNHQLWVARPGERYQAVAAEDFYKSRGEWQFKKDCDWAGREQEQMDFPAVRKYQARTRVLTHVPMDDWLEFLGYYLAEGWCSLSGHGKCKSVKIGQFRKSPHWQKIEGLLTRLGLPHRYAEDEGRFEICNAWLYDQLVALGNSYTKYVPPWVQELSRRQLSIFLAAYLNGDGHRGACWEYSSSSERLAVDIQVICLKLGWAVTLRQVFRTDNWAKQPHWRGRINRSHLRPWWKKGRCKTYKSNKEELVEYSGDVFCVTVPNHVVYCKREDKTYWSHNSGRYG